MAAARPLDPFHCSIVGTVEALGDTWSILVIRELFYGVHRFNDMQTELGISRSVLTDRLNRLVDLGVAKAVPYQEPGERVRKEYRLTRKGVALLPVMVSLMEWGDRLRQRRRRARDAARPGHRQAPFGWNCAPTTARSSRTASSPACGPTSRPPEPESGALVVETGVDPVTPRFSGVCSAN